MYNNFQKTAQVQQALRKSDEAVRGCATLMGNSPRVWAHYCEESYETLDVKEAIILYPLFRPYVQQQCKIRDAMT